MITLDNYSSDMHNAVLEFLADVFPESGKTFESNGRHSAFADIEHNFVGFWCLRDDGNIIGTVAVKKLDNNVCELKGLYLYKKYHGQKLGYRLIKTAVDFARENGFDRMVLDTVSTYRRAMKLYEKMGFVFTERYNDNQRADVFMSLELQEVLYDKRDNQ